MHWSSYNLLWKTQSGEFLLYNSLSNTFAALQKGLAEELAKIRRNPDEYDFTANPALLVQLRRAKILVKEGEERELLNRIRLQRNLEHHSSDMLGLTIAPTLACNFRCTYCYERHKRPRRMDAAVRTRLLEFIQRFKHIGLLHITWFGGEPLLEFDHICRLTEQLQARSIPFRAAMVSNGYLLNETCIAKLDELNITDIQVTIDGSKEVHDRRRPHVARGGSYDVIMANLHRLVSRWSGWLNLQINLDHGNLEEFAEVRRQLQLRFQGRNVRIYPGVVSDGPRGNPDLPSECSPAERDDFLLGLYRDTGDSGRPLYPSSRQFGCTATRRNAFVIGPEGEVYKCWHDVGNPDMVVGSIVSASEWNFSLISRYMAGTDPFADEACRSCFFLPVCSGGCPHFRLRRLFMGEEFDTCMTMKNQFTEFLELRYQKKH